MSATGFQKSLDGGWVGRMISIQVFFLFLEFYNFAKPLTVWPKNLSQSEFNGTSRITSTADTTPAKTTLLLLGLAQHLVVLD